MENQDYTVDYNLGRVRILNQGILESGTPVNIALESNSLFSIQTKTLAGARFDYKVNKDLVLGGTDHEPLRAPADPEGERGR